jgi:SagB-type dehydrogenase family enzyme
MEKDKHSDNASQVLAFAYKVFRRADGLNDVVPPGFVPNWSDKPANFRTYAAAPHVLLAGVGELGALYESYRLQAAEQGGNELSLHLLAVTFYLTAAPLSRKMDISWNAEIPPIAYTAAQYRRGSASGGGLYPTQIYLASARREGLPSGVFHYSAGKHALVPIRLGNGWKAVAEAVRCEVSYVSYLILSSDFWQNCFKYHNFGYHVCTQDAGVMMATLFLVLDALGIEHHAFLSFDDDMINRTIGADASHEGALIVIGLGRGSPYRAQTSSRTEHGVNALPTPLPRQRSRMVSIPAEFLHMHALTSEPSTKTIGAASPAEYPMGHMARDRSAFEDGLKRCLPEALASRKSAWGSMRGAKPLDRGTLLTLLTFSEARLRDGHARVRQGLSVDGISLYIQVNDVQGIPEGAYRWDSATQDLVVLGVSTPLVWQSIYSMTNYNVHEASCVIFLAGNLAFAIAEHGSRGYRIINAAMGMLAQSIYVAAPALGMDCGVVLGVRAQQAKQLFRIDADQEIFLAAFIAGRQSASYLFDFSLTQDVSVRP